MRLVFLCSVRSCLGRLQTIYSCILHSSLHAHISRSPTRHTIRLLVLDFTSNPCHGAIMSRWKHRGRGWLRLLLQLLNYSKTMRGPLERALQTAKQRATAPTPTTVLTFLAIQFSAVIRIVSNFRLPGKWPGSVGFVSSRLL